LRNYRFYGGEGGIRTPGGREPTDDFKSPAFGHSATSPEVILFYQKFEEVFIVFNIVPTAVL
jgi:hypothetical protein